jgi:Ca2+-binding EF-hand superfamily protein
LLRVKDARKAFRRRYASRLNVEKIFDQFDKDKKGYIDAYDMQE